MDFFVAGVQKGGTTAIDAYLRNHPQIQMASIKEVHHFDNDGLDWTSPSHDGLHEQFDWSVGNVIRGESTPIYTYWPGCLERIRDYRPDAKLIVGLRHPTFRAWSHWRMETKRNAETLSFEEAISTGRRRVSDAARGVHRVYSYVERGFYASQFRAIHALFPRELVHVFRTDHLWSNPSLTLSAIDDFLGIKQPARSPIEPTYIVSVDARDLGSPPEASRRYLDDLFGEDIRRTADIAGIDLSDWLHSDYSEPMSGS